MSTLNPNPAAFTLTLALLALACSCLVGCTSVELAPVLDAATLKASRRPGPVLGHAANLKGGVTTPVLAASPLVSSSPLRRAPGVFSAAQFQNFEAALLSSKTEVPVQQALAEPVELKTKPAVGARNAPSLTTHAAASLSSTSLQRSSTVRVAQGGANEATSIHRLLPFVQASAQPGPKVLLALQDLAALAKLAKKIHIRGRADIAGDAQQNDRLAARRAQAVAATLIQLGVPASKLDISHCSTCFASPGITEAQRRINRSLEIELVLMQATPANLIPKSRFVFDAAATSKKII
jgi:outer membrane protein OmpA-like peptidoglycan-associated protein